MNTMRRILLAALMLIVLIIVACSPDRSDHSTASTAASQSAAPEGGVTAPAMEVEVAGPELAGTSWRLVRIMSMDDTVDEPDDGSLYTLQFGADGVAAIGADCNRGTSAWTSESAGQLQFGLMAATRAMCPPESLSDRYLNQFEWVRSYVLKDGNLYLATMADGAIIEFEPVIDE